jgi:hypothetical protein
MCIYLWLCMWVCMCVCVCVRACVRVYFCVFGHVYAFVYLYESICMFILSGSFMGTVSLYVHGRVYICGCACGCAYVCVCVRVWSYIFVFLDMCMPCTVSHAFWLEPMYTCVWCVYTHIFLIYVYSGICSVISALHHDMHMCTHENYTHMCTYSGVFQVILAL